MEAADQARSAGHRKGIDIRKRKLRFTKRLGEADGDVLGMEPGGDLRHDATIFFVDGDLGGDDVGQKLPVFGDGHRGFVAARFDCKDPSH